jgi:hypothetical protein
MRQKLNILTKIANIYEVPTLSYRPILEATNPFQMNPPEPLPLILSHKDEKSPISKVKYYFRILVYGNRPEAQ